MNIGICQNRRLYRTVCMVLTITMILCSFSTLFFANAEESEVETQNSDESLQYNQFVPSIDYQTEFMLEQPAAMVMSASEETVNVMALPSSYSSYDMGYLSRVKSQSADPTCWIFAANAALECAINKKGLGNNVVISEEQIKMTTLTHLGDGTQVNPIGYRNNYRLAGRSGGNFDMYTSFVMNGACLVEAGGKYPDIYRTGPRDCTTGYFYDGGDPLPSLGESLLQPDYNLLKTNWILDKPTIWMNNFTGPTAAQKLALRNSIKQAVYDYGSVQTSICSETLSYTHPFVCIKDNNDGEYEIDHGVLIVGWDDNINKSYFYPDTPSVNGAFLCKNSWGAGAYSENFPEFSSSIDWPDGYFWLSYDDIYCGSISVAVCDAEKADPDQVTYFHYLHDDTSTIITIQPNTRPHSGTGTLAVKYETKYASERLDSFSFFSTNPGIEYTVYLGVTDKHTTNSTEILGNIEFVAAATGVTDNCGLYTVHFPDNAEQLIIDEPTFYILLEVSGHYYIPGETDETAKDISFFFSSTGGWYQDDYQPYFFVRTENLSESESIPIRIVTGKPQSVDINLSIDSGAPVKDTFTCTDDILNYPTGLQNGQTLDITVAKKGYLSSSYNGYISGASYVASPLKLYAGDANCDGIINLFDIAKLVQYNAKKVDPSDTANYDLYGHMDYNSDGYINLFDISITIASMEILYSDVIQS